VVTKKLLIIGFVWPEPRSSAAGSRMIQLISVFQSAGYHITFASPCAKRDNAVNLEEINVAQVSIELNNSSFDDFIKELVLPNTFRKTVNNQIKKGKTELTEKDKAIFDDEAKHYLKEIEIYKLNMHLFGD
jgi:hypothetical protein